MDLQVEDVFGQVVGTAVAGKVDLAIAATQYRKTSLAAERIVTVKGNATDYFAAYSVVLGVPSTATSRSSC